MSTNDEVAMTLLAGDALRHYRALLPAVNRVIAAYEAFVAAMNTLDDTVVTRNEHYRRMTKREALGCFAGPDIESPDRQLDVAMQSRIASSAKARDKARDEVMAAVAALAGRK